MENLKKGDVQLRLSDNSKWKFIHYGSPDPKEGYATVSANYQGDDFPRRDKRFLCVSRWDEKNNRWDEDSHEKFQTYDFKLLN